VLLVRVADLADAALELDAALLLDHVGRLVRGGEQIRRPRERDLIADRVRVGTHRLRARGRGRVGVGAHRRDVVPAKERLDRVEMGQRAGGSAGAGGGRPVDRVAVAATRPIICGLLLHRRRSHPRDGLLVRKPRRARGRLATVGMHESERPHRRRRRRGRSLHVCLPLHGQMSGERAGPRLDAGRVDLARVTQRIVPTPVPHDAEKYHGGVAASAGKRRQADATSYLRVSGASDSRMG
jgi:hypothetical protein